MTGLSGLFLMSLRLVYPDSGAIGCGDGAGIWEMGRIGPHGGGVN